MAAIRASNFIVPLENISSAPSAKTSVAAGGHSSAAIPLGSRSNTVSRTDGLGGARSHQRLSERRFGPVRRRRSGEAQFVAAAASAEATRETSQMQAGGKRPVVVLPGLGNNSGDYAELVQLLEAQGVPCEVAQVARADWLRNASGLLQADYWKGTLKPRPVVDWYLERVSSAVEAAKKRVGTDDDDDGNPKVTLVAHSAGGWLARLFLSEFGIDDVAKLVTLGSPHLPPPGGVPGVVDQTRGLLTYMQETSPGAFHAPDVKYVCISGRYVKGAPLFGPTAPSRGEDAASAAAAVAVVPTPTGIGILAAAPAASSIDAAADADSYAAAAAAAAATTGAGGEARVFALDVQPAAAEAAAAAVPSPTPTPLQAKFIGQGYKQVCGRPDVWGDGVVPEDSAHLAGAENLILDGVYHSPVGASDARPWYGSPAVLPVWMDHLLC